MKTAPPAEAGRALASTRREGIVNSYQLPTTGRIADLPSALQAQVRREAAADAYRDYGVNPVVRGYWMVPCNDGCVDGKFTLPEGEVITCVRCRGEGFMPLAMVEDHADVAAATIADARLAATERLRTNPIPCQMLGSAL